MNIPKTMLGGGEQAAGAAQRRGDARLTTSYPPPLPDADAPLQHEAARAVATDASTAPTLRPPSLTPAQAGPAPIADANAPGAEAEAAAPASSPDPAPDAARTSSAAARPASRFAAAARTTARASAESAESGNFGFTSVIRHLSLRGWLRWIHSNRSDATLRVRTREGGSGRIWCSNGKIVDAEWGALGAEDAVQEMLSLASGAVTIDFDRVDRPRRVARATHELLHVPERSFARAGDLTQAEAALAAASAGGVRSEPFRSSLFVPLGAAPPTQASLLRPRADARRMSRGEYLAGIFLLAALAVAAFAFGRMRAESDAAALATEADQTEQTKSGLRPPPPAAGPAAPEAGDLPLIPFVALEVEPPRAEIWLDQELIGLGRIQLAAIRDGALHELRFMAPGYEPKSIFFRDTPPGGRVVLTRATEPVVLGAPAEDTAIAAETGEPEAALEGAETSSAVKEDQAQPEVARRAPRRRAPPPPPAVRAAPPPEPPAAAAKSAQAKKSPQVQLIEVHTPRVQVLD